GQLINGPGYAVIGVVSQSQYNVATVTGAGSIWSNASTLYLGFGSQNNQLVITNGGKVYNGTTVISYLNSPPTYNAYSNSALVSGSGSLWSSGDFEIGYNGGGNSLVISNGGTVSSLRAFIGGNYSSYSPNAGNNTVVVTDPGSLWTNSDVSYGMNVG